MKKALSCLLSLLLFPVLLPAHALSLPQITVSPAEREAPILAARTVRDILGDSNAVLAD